MTGKQRHYLRGLGHHLDPIVQVGKEGITAGLVHATDAALVEHELIKVRVGEHAGDRHDIAAAMATSVKAELVGVVGRTVLLYRERKEEESATGGAKRGVAKIQLPG